MKFGNVNVKYADKYPEGMQDNPDKIKIIVHSVFFYVLRKCTTCRSSATMLKNSH